MAKPGDKGKDFIGPIRPPSVADAPSSVADVKKKAKLDKIAGAGTLKEVAEGIEKLTEAQEATTAAVEQVSENFPKKETKEEEKEKERSWKKMLAGIKAAIGGMSTKKAISGVWGGVLKTIKTVFKLLAFKFIGIGLMVGAFIATLPMKKLKEMWDSFKDVMISLWEMIQPILKYLWNWLNEKVFPNLVEWFIDTFKSITEMFKKIKERFSGWSEKSLWEKVKAVFGVFYDIGEAVVKIVANAVVKIAAMFGMDGTWFKNVWENITRMFNSIIDWFKETFSMENIKTQLNKAAEKIMNFGKWFYDTAVVPVVDWFKETFTMEKIKGALAIAGEKIMNFGKWIWEKTGQPVIDWFTTWPNMIDLLDKFNTAGKKILEFGQWIWGKTGKPIIDWFSDIFDGKKIKDTLSSLGAKIINFGQWIYENAIEPLIDWFKNLFDIDWSSAIKNIAPGWVKDVPIIGKWFGGDEEPPAAKEPKPKVIEDAEKEGWVPSWLKEKLGLEKKKKIIPKGIIPKDELAQLKTDEGFRSSVYEDTMGIKTVGYGFNLERAGTEEALKSAGIDKSVKDLKSGKAQLTEEEASQLMMGEMGHFKMVAQRFVGKETWDSLSGNRQGIITNMAYNMGEGTLNKFKKLQAAIRSGDWQEAQVQMADSSWANQVKGRADRLIARMGQNDSGIQLAQAGAPGGAGSGGRSNVIIAPSTVNQNNNNTPLYIEENSFANNQVDFHRA